MKKIMLGGMALALLAGCSGAEAAAPTTVTVTPPAATVTVTATTTATTTASATRATGGGLDMGQSLKTNLVTITVTQTKQVTSRETPAWAALVKTCLRADTTEWVTISWDPWSVADANDGLYPASGTSYGDDPKPKYPFAGDTIAPGKCAQGWMVFEVNADTKPVEVRYSNLSGDTAAWKLT